MDSLDQRLPNQRKDRPKNAPKQANQHFQKSASRITTASKISKFRYKNIPKKCPKSGPPKCHLLYPNLLKFLSKTGSCIDRKRHRKMGLSGGETLIFHKFKKFDTKKSTKSVQNRDPRDAIYSTRTCETLGPKQGPEILRTDSRKWLSAVGKQ